MISDNQQVCDIIFFRLRVFQIGCYFGGNFTYRGPTKKKSDIKAQKSRFCVDKKMRYPLVHE